MSKFTKQERMTDYLNDAYAQPEKGVDDWVRKHMSGSLEGWLEDFLTDTTSPELEPEWRDVNNWDADGAVEEIDATLLQLAECGDLALDDGPINVLGNGEHFGDFYTRLMDDFYTAPDTEEDVR